ncbi:rhodanese domain-containing protein CG4456-like isoform X2 [Trichoplusia ni]|uniref:Rhodanese domain-containing protein CG4456-like isoform X2 n=1 Tax=Trichoplusia ni TaxID=7111 RepID=A0A7E5W9Z9_TRINI|nr:rhodanese domain-containing protein CG4456-like isoform X2 [Trichoplusia ni]
MSCGQLCYYLLLILIESQITRILPCRTITIIKPNFNKQTDIKMVDPERVLSYDDMLKVIHQPQKVIIDVRNPDEVNTTGKIPSSINIPLDNVHNALVTMSHEEFRKHYQREKPASTDELIFYCQSGRRSSEALDKALKMGYTKSKTYLGSWSEWSKKHR